MKSAEEVFRKPPAQNVFELKVLIHGVATGQELCWTFSAKYTVTPDESSAKRLGYWQAREKVFDY